MAQLPFQIRAGADTGGTLYLWGGEYNQEGAFVTAREGLKQRGFALGAVEGHPDLMGKGLPGGNALLFDPVKKEKTPASTIAHGGQFVRVEDVGTVNESYQRSTPTGRATGDVLKPQSRPNGTPPTSFTFGKK